MSQPSLSLLEHFADLPDPRVERTRKHQLGDVLVVALCAVIAGAQSWEQIEAFGHARLPWLRRFLALPHGVPSHDTFNRVFAALDQAAFARCFGRWMASLAEACGLKAIAIDGKAVRASAKATACGCLHLVSAWAVENRLILGQQEVAEGSNETAAIPELLRVLDLKGALVSSDAAGCHKKIAALVLEQGGDYLLAVKDNQPTLRRACEELISSAIEGDFAGLRYDTHSSVDQGHGRQEERYVTVIYDPPGLPEGWPDVRAVVYVARERVVQGARSSELAIYLSSRAGKARQMGERVRGHWGIENGLHWVLDVVFQEDRSNNTSGNAGANLALLRRAALSLLKRTPGKDTIPTKRMKAAWDEDFLLEVLGGISQVFDA
jgi:predicted transposase YbfD/YdcC